MADTPPDWARSIGQTYARFGEPRMAPSYFREAAIEAFFRGYDGVLAEDAEERRLADTKPR